jgi:hypothetical protein
MRAAVTEDKALLGSNLSAGDGPKLAGAVQRARRPFRCFFFSPPALSYRPNPPPLY